MRLGYRAGFKDGGRAARKKSYLAGKADGFEEGYRSALVDCQASEQRLVATGVRLAQQNVLERLTSKERGDVPFGKWVAQVMEELEEALS